MPSYFALKNNITRRLCQINILSASELKGGITVISAIIMLIASETMSAITEKFGKHKYKKFVSIFLFTVGCIAVNYQCTDLILGALTLLLKQNLNDDTFKG